MFTHSNLKRPDNLYRYAKKPSCEMEAFNLKEAGLLYHTTKALLFDGKRSHPVT